MTTASIPARRWTLSPEDVAAVWESAASAGRFPAGAMAELGLIMVPPVTAATREIREREREPLRPACRQVLSARAGPGAPAA